MARRKTKAEAPPAAETLTLDSPEVQTVVENLRAQVEAVEEIRATIAPTPDVPPAESIPVAAAQPAEPPTPNGDIHKLPVCPKCGGTGKQPFAREGGKCFRCANDRQSPAKGYLDHVDIERNRQFDLEHTSHFWNLVVRATVDGVERAAPKSFAAGGEVWVSTPEGPRATKPADVKVDDTVLVPRLVMREGRKVAVGLLEATVLQKTEVKPALPF